MEGPHSPSAILHVALAAVFLHLELLLLQRHEKGTCTYSHTLLEVSHEWFCFQHTKREGYKSKVMRRMYEAGWFITIIGGTNKALSSSQEIPSLAVRPRPIKVPGVTLVIWFFQSITIPWCLETLMSEAFPYLCLFIFLQLPMLEKVWLWWPPQLSLMDVKPSMVARGIFRECGGVMRGVEHTAAICCQVLSSACCWSCCFPLGRGVEVFGTYMIGQWSPITS